jgi:hypothetical protein
LNEAMPLLVLSSITLGVFIPILTSLTQWILPRGGKWSQFTVVY